MPAEPVVAIHLDKATLLARACREAASELRGRASELGRLLGDHGEPLAPAAELGRVATWMDAAATLIQAMVRMLAVADSAGLRLPGLEPIEAPLHPSHESPLGATRAAWDAASYYATDREAFLRVLRSWSGDPVFAELLLAKLGPEVIVGELAMAEAAWGLARDDPTRTHHLEVARRLGDLVSVATRYGVSPLTAGDLAAAAAAEGSGPALLGLLVVEPRAFSAQFLLDLVDEVVVPLNLHAIDGGRGEPWRLHLSGSVVDSRVLVLEAAARSPASARQILGRSDLAALLDPRASYEDGGVALGDLLVAGTRPSGAAAGELGAVAQRVIEAVASFDELSSGVQRRLGEVAAPWVGALGADSFGELAPFDPLPSLPEEVARRFLDVAAQSRQAAQDLRAAAWWWAGLAFAELAAAPEPAVVKSVADVVRAVTDAFWEGEAARAREADESIERRRSTWSAAVNLASSLAAQGPAAGAGRISGGAVVNWTLPEGTAERDLLEGLDEQISDDQVRLEYLLLVALWAARDRNRLFDPDAPPPPGVGPNPPDDAELLASVESWIVSQAGAGSDPARFLDAAGEEFGRSGRDDR